MTSWKSDRRPMTKSDPIRLRNNFSNPIRSEINIFVPKSERIRSDRIRIRFGSDLHTSTIWCFWENLYHTVSRRSKWPPKWAINRHFWPDTDRWPAVILDLEWSNGILPELVRHPWLLDSWSYWNFVQHSVRSSRFDEDVRIAVKRNITCPSSFHHSFILRQRFLMDI